MPPNIKFAHNNVPSEVWMITQFFKHKDSARFQEIKECLVQNCRCPHIDRIVLINEKNYSSEYNSIKGREKIHQVITGKRLTYADFLKYVQDNVPSNVIVILCNADIYFKNDLTDLWKINMENTMLGLLRWDVTTTPGEIKIFGPRADSQDTWIFLSDSIQSRKWNFDKYNFQLGQPGCDNAFAGYILRDKFLLSNPALTFKTYHLHNTNIRNYEKKDYIRADIYINLAPTYIIDSKQIKAPTEKAQTLANETVAFEVKSSSISNEITYCTMLEKEGRYKWEPSVVNYYFEPEIPVYSWNNCIVTPNGLVYNLYSIYTGNAIEDDLFNYWKTSNIDILTPVKKCKQMLAIPFRDTSVFYNIDRYLLNYMSRCMRLLETHPEASFWIPPEFIAHLECLVTLPLSLSLHGISFNHYSGCYADTVIGFLPEKESVELGSEDIQCLRKLYPNWIQTPQNKKCSVIIDQQLTLEFAKTRLSKCLLATTTNNSAEWSIQYIMSGTDTKSVYNDLMGSSLCIFIGGKNTENVWSKLWTLPNNCCVIEFQQELLIDGEFQHLSHVAGLKSWVLLLSKGDLNDVQDQIQEQFTKWLKKNGSDIIME
jgi:hypothetical protein